MTFESMALNRIEIFVNRQTGQMFGTRNLKVVNMKNEKDLLHIYKLLLVELEVDKSHLLDTIKELEKEANYFSFKQM